MGRPGGKGANTGPWCPCGCEVLGSVWAECSGCGTWEAISFFLRGFDELFENYCLFLGSRTCVSDKGKCVDEQESSGSWEPQKAPDAVSTTLDCPKGPTCRMPQGLSC